MAVSIDEMVSTVETDASKGGEAAESPTQPPMDMQTFVVRYGAAVRAIVREEIERYLRSIAD